MSIQGTPNEARPSSLSQAAAERNGHRSVADLVEITATPAEQGPKGSAAPARFYRTHSLIDLECERNPSLDQLLNERDPWAALYTPLGEWMGISISKLVRERDASE